MGTYYTIPFWKNNLEDKYMFTYELILADMANVCIILLILVGLNRGPL